jgi:cytochrome c biogenesis protein
LRPNIFMPPANDSKGVFTQVYDFFASVKLALVLLFALAITSILGTVLPQGEPLEFYFQGYSPWSAKMIQVFQLYDMYHSWWFQWILLLLTINLIVCSIRRFSVTWKVVQAPPRSVSTALFTGLPFSQRFFVKKKDFDLAAWTDSLSRLHLGKPEPLEASQGQAFYMEKGRLSRFGVYLVHGSILIIFMGALIGSLYGFKGFLELKEGERRDRIFLKSGENQKMLDFTVKLDRFAISFYPNGMPKEYRSDLSFWELGQEKEKAIVRVNDPVTYKGITFYQSSWDQSPKSINLSLIKGDQETKLTLRMFQPVPIPESPYTLQAVRFNNNLADFGPAVGLVLLKGNEEIEGRWVLVNQMGFHGNRLGEYKVRIGDIEKSYVSGFQVNRDPGVWFIWIGCSLMLIGFMVAFYLSHQQVWIWIREERDAKGTEKMEIRIGGTAHKNRGAFVHKMEFLTEKLSRGTHE